MTSSGYGRPAPGFASVGSESSFISSTFDRYLRFASSYLLFASMQHIPHACPRMTARKSSTKLRSKRRSPCPVACSLDLFGDRWTLLVVRDLLLGRTRYKEFQESPEGIPTNLLADRLERLVSSGIATRVPVEDGSKHLGYQLTKKGLALRPILKAMRDWALTWEPGTRVELHQKD